MTRGYEEVSTSQAGHKRGTPQEMLTARSLVTAMSTEELGLYNQVPIEISLEMLDGSTASTIWEENNAIYFT